MIYFLKLQWRMGKITEEYLDHLVEIKRITEDDKIKIMEE